MILAIPGWFLLLWHGYGRFLGLLMVLYDAGWFWRVIYCSGRFRHDLWIVLYDVGWFWPVLYCSSEFWPDLWIDFWRSSLI